jgi:hypothetical protein
MANAWATILKAFPSVEVGRWLCSGSDKQLNMRFMRTPVEMLSAQLGTVSGVTLEKTKLQREGSKQIAVCTGELETIHVGAFQI